MFTGSKIGMLLPGIACLHAHTIGIGRCWRLGGHMIKLCAKRMRKILDHTHFLLKPRPFYVHDALSKESLGWSNEEINGKSIRTDFIATYSWYFTKHLIVRHTKAWLDLYVQYEKAPLWLWGHCPPSLLVGGARVPGTPCIYLWDLVYFSIDPRFLVTIWKYNTTHSNLHHCWLNSKSWQKSSLLHNVEDLIQVCQHLLLIPHSYTSGK